MNEVLIESLADNGDSSYVSVGDPVVAQKVFVEYLTYILQMIDLDNTPALAGGAREIEVDFNPEVVAYYYLTVQTRIKLSDVLLVCG